MASTSEQKIGRVVEWDAKAQTVRDGEFQAAAGAESDDENAGHTPGTWSA